MNRNVKVIGALNDCLCSVSSQQQAADYLNLLNDLEAKIRTAITAASKRAEEVAK